MTRLTQGDLARKKPELMSGVFPPSAVTVPQYHKVPVTQSPVGRSLQQGGRRVVALGTGRASPEPKQACVFLGAALQPL